MLNLEIPGHEPLHLEHLVLDRNGTLAVDIIAPSITAALDLFLHPLRLAATLRS